MNYNEVIDDYASAFDRLTAALQSIPDAAYHFKPSPEAWSIHQIIIHVADAEVSGYVRFRKAIAEDGVTVDVYDQNAWTERLNYDQMDAAEALALFRYLRSATTRLLRSCGEEIWGGAIVHPEGGRMTLAELVPYYDEHVTKHCGQIRRTFEAWQNKT
jgi:uncharacterized damage-inducible protein DinB